MAAPIGPGDWVECVNTCGDENIVALHSIHRVEEAGLTPSGRPGLVLEGVRHPENGARWVWAECFRPIYPGKGLLRKLMEPVPGGLLPSRPRQDA